MDATILVNRTHRLPRKAIPQTLVEPEIIFDAPVGDRKRLLAASAAKGVEALFARGKEEGIYLCGVSGYRSYERQEELYQKKLREQPKENGDPVHWIAPPGASEHQTGLALDVSCQAVDYQLDERFGETREGRWLKRCAPLYGFILRYPKGKEHITGYGWDAGVPPCCYIVYHQLFIVKVRYRAIISATFASASEIGSVRFMPRKHTAPTGSPSRVTGTSACSVCASSSVTG